VLSTDITACGTQTTHVYNLGAPISPASIYEKSGSSCVSGGPPLSEYSYYQVGAEIPAASFVGSTIGVDP
jgi:hypothetical protein